MTSNPSTPIILVASADDIARQATARILRDADFKVSEAYSYDLVITEIQSQRPTLIILDSSLPESVKLCRHLKKDTDTQTIMLLKTCSSPDEASTIISGSDLDADNYLMEPVAPAVLIANVRVLLRLEKIECAYQELVHWKAKFLSTFATLTHDLRNILAPILNAIELMFKLDPVVPQMQNKARNTIKLQAKALVGIADELLEVSRKSRGVNKSPQQESEASKNQVQSSPAINAQPTNTDSPLPNNTPSSELENAAAAPAAPKKVLIVDDYADVADTLAQWLRLAGHNVRTAYTGAEAIASTSEFQPDVVLLDIGLPDSSGFDIAKKLRALPNMQKFLLVAVTGYGQASLRKSVLEAGFDEHFAKPMNFEKLGSIGLHV